MDKQKHVDKPVYSFMPVEVEGFDSLAELALDMRWSWSHYGDKVWRQLDQELWEMTQNPWVLLQTVSREKLENLLSIAEFRREIDELLELKGRKSAAPARFQQNYAKAPFKGIEKKLNCLLQNTHWD